jgi:hypothetical protein
MGKHAYINIEPNNGGIVLNVSDGGLCFHSFDKVQPNGTIRFWFSENNQRIEATGAVTWTDETQKGGLRFVDMPAEAREKIGNWIGQPGIPMPKPEGAVSAGPRPRASVLSASPTAETVPTSFRSTGDAFIGVTNAPANERVLEGVGHRASGFSRCGECIPVQ